MGSYGPLMNTERDDILDLLTKHRELFRFTVQGLTDEQAAATPTVSELCLGGLIKHVTQVERNWADFIVNGPAEPIDWANVDWSNPPPALVEHANGFKMNADDTLDDLLASYAEACAVTDDLVRTVELGARQPLPVAPWFEADATWSARRVFAHLAVETAQHAGHADIIRESIDGQKSMG